MEPNKQDLIIQGLIEKNFRTQSSCNVEDVVMHNILQKGDVVKKADNYNRAKLVLLSITFMIECTLVIYPEIFTSLFRLIQYPLLILGIQSVLILIAILQLDSIYRFLQTTVKPARHQLNTN